MTWFTETPWPPMVIFTVLAIASVSCWSRQRKGIYLIGAVIWGVAVIGTYVIERFVVSERERIESFHYEMADAFGHRDEQGVLQHISPREDALRSLVSWGFDTVTETTDLRITDVSVRMLMENSRATSHFRANGHFHVKAYGDVGHRPTRWELTWQREGPDWKIIRIRRLNPITGEEIDQRAMRQ